MSRPAAAAQDLAERFQPRGPLAATLLSEIERAQLAPIPLDQLPQWSPWPARIAGLSPWSKPVRNLEKIEQEYDRDKFGRCLEFVRKKGAVDVDELRRFEIGLQEEDKICVSLGQDLFAAPLSLALKMEKELLIQAIAPHLADASAVVELGCGWGHNLGQLARIFPDKQFIGGDYSRNAVEVASLLFHGRANIQIERFNFYDSHYSILNRARPPVVVLTVFAVEQLDSAAHFIAAMRSGPQILRVVNIEPLPPPQPATVLQILRTGYFRLNSYCEDLAPLLASQIGDVQMERDIFGLNPIHPASIISWADARS